MNIKKHWPVGLLLVVGMLVVFLWPERSAQTRSIKQSTFVSPKTDTFQATPLTDFAPGQLYLDKFPGFLYNSSNTMPTKHDTDGKNIAAKIRPLDVNGKLSTSTGKIVVAALGFSNWTQEMCLVSPPYPAACQPNTFLDQIAKNIQVDHTKLVVVDCAQEGHTPTDWLNDSIKSYTFCKSSVLSPLGLTEKQVQVVLWKDGERYPTVSLSSSTTCTVNSTEDACLYEKLMGQVIRFAKTRYPNLKQMFMHTRIYGGYALNGLNPEPFAYETGFGTKWLINAQINQIVTSSTDPVAGDLGYGVAPWLAWGSYFWAAGATPCANCEPQGLTWDVSDLRQNDRTHPDVGAQAKVADSLLNFYLTSPYSPWFRATSTSDTVPPSVTVSGPTPGSSVSGTLVISAIASDNVGITDVQFLVDGAPVSSPIPGSPYQFSFNSTSIPNGTHILAARAWDSALNYRTSQGTLFTTVNANPATVSCSPLMQTTTIKTPVALLAAGGTSYFWSATSGLPHVGVTPSFTTFYNTSGSYTVTVNSGASAATCSVIVQ